MYFEFEDYRPDTPRIDAPISKREGVLLSIIFHGVFIAAVIFLLPLLDNPEARLAALQRAQELALAQQERAEQQRRFVFVQPRVDQEAPKAPVLSEDSDLNRTAQAPDRVPNPTNPLPFARGNSTERVDAPELVARARPTPETPPQPPTDQKETTPAAGDRTNNNNSTSKQAASVLPEGRTGPRLSTEPARSGTSDSGSLSAALRNLQRYVQQESFDNPQGGPAQFGPWIQFDTKGVEFGPWIRRFVAQIKGNWIVPYAAMAMSGHVVMTFNVHKNGSISALEVAQPSSIDGFNNAALNALATSNPTYPLPPEYPSDSAFFTVTFYYNETPPGQ